MSLTRDYSHYVKELDAGVAHLDLAVEGVSCAGCMAKIERGLSAIPDVTRARVNLTDRRLAVEWKKGAVDPAALIDRLAELGYKAYPFEPVRAEIVEAEQSRFLLRCLGVAAFAAMNVMMLSIPVWSGNVSDMLPEQRARGAGSGARQLMRPARNLLPRVLPGLPAPFDQLPDKPCKRLSTT